MNKNVAVFILLSISFGLGAVFIAKNWIEGNKPKDLKAGQVNVVSVNAPLSTGSTIDIKHLTLTTLPEAMVPEGSVTSIEDATGMIVKQKLYPGEILRKERIGKKGEGSALASLISPNMRAVSIRVNDVVGVAGFVLPGNRVDILLTSKGAHTEVVLSNVKILAVDQRASNDENKPQIVRAVTLEVNIEQAEILMSAMKRGSIQLALRNPNDKTDSIVESDNIDTEIASNKEEKNTESSIEIKPLNLASTGNKVEIIRGIKKQSVKVSN